MKFLENKYFAEEIPDITERLVIKKLTERWSDVIKAIFFCYSEQIEL